MFKKERPQPHQNEERVRRLKAMIVDRRSFMQDRLKSFVGRQTELADIRQCINNTMKTGGYVTITGQAGQGKSSIIAKLIEQTDSDTTVFHFIPFNPGPDHQVGLLRNIMASLILKHDLSDLYVAAESRPALRDYFLHMLKELAGKDAQEVIFIDGLDQIEEDLNGVQDLSFLLPNPLKGIVFVLGTRSDNSLRPLALLKPHVEYQLLRLSRGDFDLVLAHHQVSIDRTLADQIYEGMEGNARYLDLVAEELMRGGTANSAEIIKSVSDDSDHLFSLSFQRLRRNSSQWRRVLKPMLGLLLVACESLTARQIGKFLAIESDDLEEGLNRLGGLLTKDGRQRYSFFHAKLYSYLRQDENNPDKYYIFSTDEVWDAHQIIVNFYLRTIGLL